MIHTGSHHTVRGMRSRTDVVSAPTDIVPPPAYRQRRASSPSPINPDIAATLHKRTDFARTLTKPIWLNRSHSNRPATLGLLRTLRIPT